jgi:hypothetical protein
MCCPSRVYQFVSLPHTLSLRSAPPLRERKVRPLPPLPPYSGEWVGVRGRTSISVSRPYGFVPPVPIHPSRHDILVSRLKTQLPKPYRFVPRRKPRHAVPPSSVPSVPHWRNARIMHTPGEGASDPEPASAKWAPFTTEPSANEGTCGTVAHPQLHVKWPSAPGTCDPRF